nr:MAG TPA: hypothetical protein [Caudoviricetes sp.]
MRSLYSEVAKRLRMFKKNCAFLWQELHYRKDQVGYVKTGNREENIIRGGLMPHAMFWNAFPILKIFVASNLNKIIRIIYNGNHF